MAAMPSAATEARMRERAENLRLLNEQKEREANDRQRVRDAAKNIKSWPLACSGCSQPSPALHNGCCEKCCIEKGFLDYLFIFKPTS
jgi:hypothetical protein